MSLTNSTRPRQNDHFQTLSSPKNQIQGTFFQCHQINNQDRFDPPINRSDFTGNNNDMTAGNYVMEYNVPDKSKRKWRPVRFRRAVRGVGQPILIVTRWTVCDTAIEWFGFNRTSQFLPAKASVKGSSPRIDVLIPTATFDMHNLSLDFFFRNHSVSVDLLPYS